MTTLADIRAAIDSTPDLDLPDPKTVPVDVPRLVEKPRSAARWGCCFVWTGSSD